MREQALKSRFRRLTPGESFILLIFVLVIGSLGFIAYSEAQLTPSFMKAQSEISLGADGLGMFIYKVRGGYFTGIENRPTIFEVSPKTGVQLISLNGKSVGAASGTEPTDRSGRVVVVVKAGVEGPITLKGTDVESGRSATVIQWSAAN